MREIGAGRIASISGRYYAMDRDKRWERIERAFAAMVAGAGEKSTDPVAAMKRSYEKGVTDEFIEPVTIVDARNEPVGLIRDDDAVHLLQLSRRSRSRDDGGCSTKSATEACYITTMTQYDKTLHRSVRAAEGAARTTSWPTSWPS